MNASEKTGQLHVRMTHVELQALKGLSVKHGGTVADLVRSALLALPGFREAQAAGGQQWVETRQLGLFERASKADRVHKPRAKKKAAKKRPKDTRRR